MLQEYLESLDKGGEYWDLHWEELHQIAEGFYLRAAARHVSHYEGLGIECPDIRTVADRMRESETHLDDAYD